MNADVHVQREQWFIMKDALVLSSAYAFASR